MKREFSAGVIVFTQENLNTASEPEYLLLQYSKGYWDFPKGKLEAEETALDAAIRELKEETNLEAQIIEGFKESISYFFKTENKELVHKTVTFFLAQSLTKKVKISFEHLNYKWLPFKEAIKELTYLNAQEILIKAEKFINSRLKKT